MPTSVKDLADDYPLEYFQALIPRWELYRPKNSKDKWRARRPAGGAGELIHVGGSRIQTVVVKALLKDYMT